MRKIPFAGIVLTPNVSEAYKVPLRYRGDRSTLLYSSIIRLYALNPVFEIVHHESVKVYLPVHLYNGNVQQNPLWLESCVTMTVFTLGVTVGR